jgi:hypothetical protein
MGKDGTDDQAEGLRRAVEICQAALDACTPETSPSHG